MRVRVSRQTTVDKPHVEGSEPTMVGTMRANGIGEIENIHKSRPTCGLIVRLSMMSPQPRI
jgi:hypothetical protein